MSNHIEIGDEVRDAITGFKGIVVGRSDWINGCTRFAVQSRKLADDGTPTESQWIDQEQLVALKKKAQHCGIACVPPNSKPPAPSTERLLAWFTRNLCEIPQEPHVDDVTLAAFMGQDWTDYVTALMSEPPLGAPIRRQPLASPETPDSDEIWADARQELAALDFARTEVPHELTQETRDATIYPWTCHCGHRFRLAAHLGTHRKSCHAA